MPVYRCVPEDFEVEELLAYEPSGEGDHAYLLVEKRDRTTEQVARQIAAALGCRASEVGYAGRKDRYAVARQWFSAPAPPGPAIDTLELDGATVTATTRHPHRLRTGKLRGNRFRLVIRELALDSVELLERRLESIARWGFPNRFGAQRFGRDGDNAERGRALLERGARPRDRRSARFLVSALQSAVFNRLLERRDELFGDSSTEGGRRGIDRLEVGDLAVKSDTGGVFEVVDLVAEQTRADALEISPTGVLFGRKARLAAGRPGELERSVLAEGGVEGSPRLPGVRFDGARRSLRALPASLDGEIDGDTLTVGVELSAGTYASVLLEELFSDLDLVEADRARGSVDARSTE